MFYFILDVGLMPDTATSIFVAIATDGNHFVLVEEAVEFFTNIPKVK